MGLFTADILICYSRKSSVVTNIHEFSVQVVPVSHDSVTVSRHAQNQDHETKAIIHFVIYAGAFPAVRGQNIFCEKGLGALT